MTDEDLIEALRDCYDPLLRRNVVEMGLVRAATVVMDGVAPGAGIAGVPRRYVARVRLAAPGSDEAANGQLVAQVRNRLAGLEWVSRSEVEMVGPVFAILNARLG